LRRERVGESAAPTSKHQRIQSPNSKTTVRSAIVIGYLLIIGASWMLVVENLFH
jgi:hypothetical protein